MRGEIIGGAQATGTPDPDGLDPDGALALVRAILTSAAAALKRAKEKNNQEAVDLIEWFYLSERCQFFVESIDRSYEQLLEANGLKAQWERIQEMRQIRANYWRRVKRQREKGAALDS